MKTRIVNIVLGVVIGVILILFLQPKHIDQSDIIKQKERAYKHRIDSLDVIISNLKKRDSLWDYTVYVLRVDKDKASREAETYRKKYEKIKNARVPVHLDQRQYDSLLSTLF